MTASTSLNADCRRSVSFARLQSAGASDVGDDAMASLERLLNDEAARSAGRSEHGDLHHMRRSLLPAPRWWNAMLDEHGARLP